jgi:hypothetical protein
MLDPLSAAAEALGHLQFTSELWKLLRDQVERLIVSRSDRFLEYDPRQLREWYAEERPVAPALSYTLICDLIGAQSHRGVSATSQPIVLRHTTGRFQLADGRGGWPATVASGYQALLDSGRISDNETLVRVSEYSEANGVVELQVQRAKYHDQARSNLILDFDRRDPGKYASLRSQLRAQCGEKLPPLSDKRLANTLGAAVLIFYRSRGQWIPYLLRRVKRIGVFPGGIHCSASGAIKWPSSLSKPSFETLVTGHLLDEIEEELGLTSSDLADLQPVAFCREMARGGKPQMFYCARTDLSRMELANRRIHAARVNAETKQWKEVEADRWYRSADVVMSPSRLRHGLVTWGVTLEGAAALYFGLHYLRSLPRHT